MKMIELLLNEKSMNKFSPSHYQRGKIQVWDFIADQELDFFTGNVVKYVCRAGHKDQEGELDDLKKAKQVLHILTREQLSFIRDRLDTGGKK